jgi:hypothetical protein
MKQRGSGSGRFAHGRMGAVAWVLASSLVCSGCAQLGVTAEDAAAILGTLGGGAPQALDEATVASGLREALGVGTRRAVGRTSVVDGFWSDARIRIPVPEPAERLASGLRGIGLGAQVDAFERSMNRAGERASAEAVDVFLDAILRLTIPDALGILRGPDDAATQYLRRTAGTELARRFTPIVDAKMREVGVTRLYGEMVAQLDALPVLPRPNLDLTEYVTSRAVDGLFVVVSDEEARIRRDPAARTTELLKKVFGSRR